MAASSGSRAAGLALAATALVGMSAPVHAQQARNPALAQALFEEARRLSQAGDHAEACPKFKASYELDPAGGTLLNLADCYEHTGQTALAWSTFEEALVAARRDGRSERVEYAERHIADLEGKLVHLQVDVAPAARVPGLSVDVDGAPLAEAAWGVALPVDPGPHVVHASAPGKAPFERRLVLAGTPGSREVLVIEALSDVASSDASSTPVTPLAANGEVGADAPAASSTQATIGWVLGGAGLISLGVGSYFGVRAISRWDERNAACVGGCTEAARRAGGEAQDAATLATIGVGAGVVALGVATVLILSAPDPAQAAASHTVLSRLALAPREDGVELSWAQAW